MTAKNWKRLGYFMIVLFFILFFQLDGDTAYFNLVFALPLFSILFFRISKIKGLNLDVLSDETILESVKNTFGAWAVWKTNKRLVIYWPIGPKKGINKMLTSMATEGKDFDKQKGEPFGYFLINSTNIEGVFNKETGFVSLNLDQIDSIEMYEEKIGIKKWGMRRIKLKDEKTQICLHLGSIGGGKKAFKLLDSLK